jgi:hypothetical protein
VHSGRLSSLLLSKRKIIKMMPHVSDSEMNISGGIESVDVEEGEEEATADELEVIGTESTTVT